jgi:NAD(P)-dependent dehydrogenase (short-subunit alcohol dehydrogenase family)
MSEPLITIHEPSAPHPRDLLDFAGRTVIVTGAGSGIGTGIAHRFAQAGANVVVNYRSASEGAAAVVAAIETSGGQAIAMQADVTREIEVANLVAAAVEHFGGLDVMVNNAGIYPRHALLEMSADAWSEVVDANLRSAFLCTQAAARQMIASGTRGAIVNIASIEAENPAPDHSHYVAAKGGLVMYGMAAAGELGRHGIRVNTVSPGLIWQKGLEEAWPEGVESYLAAVPLGRLGLADDVADACLFLASPAARWISGANLRVDGGVMTHRVY